MGEHDALNWDKTDKISQFGSQVGPEKRAIPAKLRVILLYDYAYEGKLKHLASVYRNIDHSTQTSEAKGVHIYGKKSVYMFIGH